MPPRGHGPGDAYAIVGVWPSTFPQGAIFPSLYALVAQWAPEEERTRSITVITSGTSIGACITIGLAPHIVEQKGWDVLFLGMGYLGVRPRRTLEFGRYAGPLRSKDSMRVALTLCRRRLVTSCCNTRNTL